MKAKVNVAELFRLWHMPVNEMPTVEIAKRLNVGISTVYSMARDHKLRKRERNIDHELSNPTKEEIEEMTRQIRQSWPPGEAERRWVGPGAKRWSLPSYMYDGRDCSFAGNAVDF